MKKWLFSIVAFLCCSCGSLRQITPQLFGAQADGINDDYTAIQTALDHGGMIYFPAGTYLVSNTLHVTKSHTHLKLNKNAVIECNNQTIRDPKYGNAGATLVFNSLSCINNPLEDGERIVDVGIKGGTIRNRAPEDQKYPPFNNENAIGFTHCRNFYCSNVTIEYCNRKGITLQYYNDDGVIEGCILNNCGVHGITIESCSNNIKVRNNTINMRKASLSRGENTGNGNNYGMHIIESRGINVFRNVIETDCGVGIYSNDCYDVTFQNNRVNSINERALVLVAKPDSHNEYVIKGNTLNGLNYSLYLSGSDSQSTFVIDNNVCSSDIRFAKGVVKLKRNKATVCTISQPIESPQVFNNYFHTIDVTNASEQTRPISKGNVLIDGYHNWGPLNGNDKIKKDGE